MTVEQRQEAERALRQRDRQLGRSPRDGFPLPSLSPSPSPERSGDEDARRKRRRTSRSDPGTPAGSLPDVDLDEEDVPEATYDLTHERLGDAAQVEKRLEGKIKRCFQQFLLKFA